jgi:hypothetical protein
MANAGVFLKDNGLDPSTGVGLTETDGFLAAAENNNMFTGAGMNDLLARLDDNNQAIVYIGGAPHLVKATATYRDASGRNNFPVIKWEVLALGADAENKITLNGQLTSLDGGVLRARNAGGLAEEILKNKKLESTEALRQRQLVFVAAK